TSGSAVPDSGATVDGFDLIVESSSLGSGTTVGSTGAYKFKTKQIPLLLWEASNVDDAGFQAANDATYAGTQINITDPTNPSAAGNCLMPLWTLHSIPHRRRLLWVVSRSPVQAAA